MLNKSIIMGRFVADPELRRTNSGTAVATFTLAVERDGKPGEDGRRATDFIDCVAWRGTAEFVSKWFAKGRMAAAEGRIQTRTWKDRNDQNRKSTELVIDNIYFADSKREGEAPAPAGYAPTADAFAELTDEDGELPF